MPFTPGRVSDLGDNKFEPITRCAFTKITGDRVILEPEVSPIREQENPPLEVLVCLFENTPFDGLGHTDIFVANEVATNEARRSQTSRTPAYGSLANVAYPLHINKGHEHPITEPIRFGRRPRMGQSTYVERRIHWRPRFLRMASATRLPLKRPSS